MATVELWEKGTYTLYQQSDSQSSFCGHVINYKMLRHYIGQIKYGQDLVTWL